MGTAGDGTAARQDRAARLAALRAAADATGPRTCRWPACGLDAVPVGARGPDVPAAPSAAGGRRAEFCSEAHQRATRRAVRDLLALLADARSLRADAPVREHKAIDAAVADLEHRLALHGEPVPAAPPGPAVLATVVDLRPADPLDRPAVTGEPALALRPGRDPADFAEDWAFFRDAVDGARPLLERLRRAPGDAERQRIAAAGWHDTVDLVRGADQLLGAVVRTRPAAAARADER